MLTEKRKKIFEGLGRLDKLIKRDRELGIPDHLIRDKYLEEHRRLTRWVIIINSK